MSCVVGGSVLNSAHLWHNARLEISGNASISGESISENIIFRWKYHELLYL
jgi:hypothetical protein